MIIRDMIPGFELFQPATVDDAVALLGGARQGRLAARVAATTALTGSRTAAKRPKAVIDLGGIAELPGIREAAGGLEIGAMTTLTEIANNRWSGEVPGARRRRRQGRQPADPQSGTLGGNVSPGHPLLVLPRRPALLPGRRQHLLRRHAGSA